MCDNMKQNALILVDFENEWVNKKSPYFVGDISKVITKTNKLIDFCRKNNSKIIFIRHVERNSDIAFAEGSKNVEIIKELQKNESDIVITKHKISSFYKTSLNQQLKRITRIVICGILTNLCVRSLAQDAYDRDFEITIIKDCCVALNQQIHKFTLQDLKATREEIEIVNLNQFI